MKDRGSAYRKKDLAGYMTVEASLVMIIVLSVWIALVFLSFYLYNRCRLEQELTVLCFREGVRKEESGTGDGSGISAGALEAAYVGLSGVSVGGSRDGNRICAKASGRVVPADLAWFLPVPESFWQIHVSAAAGVRDTPHAIRKFNRTEDVLKSVAAGLDTDGGEE